MSLQTAYYNQPSYTASVGNGQSWTANSSVPTTPTYTPGMTQMPNVPQPPFMNSTSIPVSTGQSYAISLPDIPSPWQVAPSVMGSGGGTQPYSLAQSVPVSQPLSYTGPVAEIPPPHMVAPWLYIQRPNQMPVNPNQNWNGQNGLNGLNGQNGMQGQQQQPPQPPPQQPPQPPQQPPQQKAPSADLNGGELSDATINSLNERLNNSSEDVRADAAMDLYKILEGNPSLAENKMYAPYINAFMDKIIQDPSPVVRGAGEFILEMGKVPNPTDTVKSKLKELSQKSSMTGEDMVSGNILGRIQSGTLRKTTPAPAPAPAQTQAGQPDQKGTAQGGGAQQTGAQPQGGVQTQGGQPPQPQGGQQGFSQPPQQQPPGNPQWQGPQQGQTLQPQPTYAMQGGGIPMQQNGMPQQQGTSMPGGGGFPMAQGQTSYLQQGGMPQTGGRLNMMSPQQGMPMAQGYPQAGQRLNIQEGYR